MLLINCTKFYWLNLNLNKELDSLLDFSLLYAKHRVLEIYYNFFEMICDADKYKEIEMDTESFYLVPSGENLEDVILSTKRCPIAQINSLPTQKNFFPRKCCKTHKDQDTSEPGLF